MSGSAHPIHVGGEEIGSIAGFAPADAGEPWSYVGVENGELAIASVEIANGQLRDWNDGQVFPLTPVSTLEECFAVGPTHHLIGHLPGKEPIGAFEFHPFSTLEECFAVGPTHDLIGHLAGRDPRGAFEFHPLEKEVAADVSLWAANCQTQKRLLVSPTHKGVPVRPELAQRMRSKKSKLHYSRNMSWTSQALLAAMTADLAMGGRTWTALGGSTWTALGHSDERVQKAFALWANGILGMITHWTRGQRTHKGRSRVQIGALKKIPCPNLLRLNGDRLDGAAKAFDELARLELRPACQAHCDPVRKRIDEAVCELLSIPPKWNDTIDQLRIAWCAEPSVHGNNKTALKLLAQPSN